jgi:hypothetical protein
LLALAIFRSHSESPNSRAGRPLTQRESSVTGSRSQKCKKVQVHFASDKSMKEASVHILCISYRSHVPKKKHLSDHFSKIFSPSLARCLMFGAGSVKSRKRLINGTLSAWISKNQRKTREKMVQIKQDLLILDLRFFKNSFDFRIISWSVMGMQHVEIIADGFIQ